MKEPVWVRRDVVLAFHERLLAEHGGAAGIRDEGMLESALGRPENVFAYGKPTLFDLAVVSCLGAGDCESDQQQRRRVRKRVSVAVR